MSISTVGPSGPDPFAPTQGTPPEEAREPVKDNETREPAPLPPEKGTIVDTSV